MAIITASSTGGIWSATTSWSGGVVPTTSDDVVFAATSGNIYITTPNPQVRSLDASQFSGIFGLSSSSASITISNPVGTSSILFSATMSFTFSAASISDAAGNIIYMGNNATQWSICKFSGQRLPGFAINVGPNSRLQILDDVVDCNWITQNFGNAISVVSNTNLRARYYYRSTQGGQSSIRGTGLTISIVDANPNIGNINYQNIMPVGCDVVIDAGSSSRVSFTSLYLLSFSSTGALGGTAISGNLFFKSGIPEYNWGGTGFWPRLFVMTPSDATGSFNKIDCGNMTFSTISISSANSSTNNRIELLSDLRWTGTFSFLKAPISGQNGVEFVYQSTFAPAYAPVTQFQQNRIWFSGSGVLKGGALSADLITLTASGTHSVSALLPSVANNFFGPSFSRQGLFGTGSTNATIQVGSGTSECQYYTIRNINSVYTLNNFRGTQSNTTNVVITDVGSSVSAISGGSFTFLT